MIASTYYPKGFYCDKLVLSYLLEESMENHNYENEGQFQRKMTSRHLFMLSLGGVIGTG
ncbi:amino acid permease, partial [Streptococcus vestibularis]|nr:amino acid permease [Streptococcus vestibularis]